MSHSSTGRESATNPTSAEPSHDEAEQQHVLEQEEAQALKEEESQLDLELHVIRKMRLAFEASLQMLEAARGDLEEIGERMDRLAAACVVDEDAATLLGKAGAEEVLAANGDLGLVDQA